MVNVTEHALQGKSTGFFWENAGRIAEVRREGTAEVCEASGPGLRVITVTDRRRGLKVSARVDSHGTTFRWYRVKDDGNGRLISTARTPEHEHLIVRVLQSLNAAGRV